MARVAVFGMGYVGCVTAACLSRDGHLVVGVDINPDKVAALLQGKAPVVEPGLSELLEAAAAKELLQATIDPIEAVRSTDMAILCVGTPTGPDESPDLRALAAACGQIGRALEGLDRPYTVLVRSTVPPGTAEDLVNYELATASRRAVGPGDGDIMVLSVPEFLREATALADYDDPALFVVGGPTPPPPRAVQTIRTLFGQFEECCTWVSYRTAELLKNVCNAYHAAKVVFSNEVGALCQAVGIDGIELMRVFCQDTKLNLSAAYLRPGMPFGGSCLPKDLRALLYMGRRYGVELPQLGATLRSNELHIERAIDAIRALGRRRIGLEGLAFKPGTDDIRESPMVAIAEQLIGRGYDLRIYDPLVHRSSACDRSDFAHLAQRLVPEPDDFLRHSEVLVRSRSSLDLLQRAREMGLRPEIVDLGRPPYRIAAASSFPPPLPLPSAAGAVSSRVPGVTEALPGTSPGAS